MTDKFKPALPFTVKTSIVFDETITWVEDQNGITVCDLYHKYEGGFFVKPNAAEHAELIVQTCNTQHEMVDLFKDIKQSDCDMPTVLFDRLDAILANVKE